MHVLALTEKYEMFCITRTYTQTHNVFNECYRTVVWWFSFQFPNSITLFHFISIENLLRTDDFLKHTLHWSMWYVKELLRNTSIIIICRILINADNYHRVSNQSLTNDISIEFWSVFEYNTIIEWGEKSVKVRECVNNICVYTFCAGEWKSFVLLC